MEVRVTKSDLLSALAPLKLYYGTDNAWPYASFAIRDGALLVYGTDRNAFTCTTLPAEITEESEVMGLVGLTLEQLVKSTQGEAITLRSTEQNLFIEDDYKFKARLARSVDMPSLIDTFIQAKNETSTDVLATFTKDNLSRLLSLSMAFPPHTQSDKRWCVITADSGQYSGSIQETEAGGIESMPLEVSYESAEISATITFQTKLFQQILAQAENAITIQSGIKRSSRVVVYDPHNSNWWTVFGQFLRPGETID